MAAMPETDHNMGSSPPDEEHAIAPETANLDPATSNKSDAIHAQVSPENSLSDRKQSPTESGAALIDYKSLNWW
jgi:hypothetical protein